MSRDYHVLVIEDDEGLQSQLRWCFDAARVSVASDADAARQILEADTPQLVTLDLGLPPDAGGVSVGFELLGDIRRNFPATKVVVITGREERDHAIRAVAEGAYDFYQKPIDSETLAFVAQRALALWELEEENRRLSQLGSDVMPLEGLITQCPQVIDICRQVERVASTDASVLLLGETGTGKEIVANALHQLSGRDGGFVAINCAAIPETLLESELFGHEKGAFTGASGRKKGKIEAADGGTLFLDEIGDMPLALQAKILRFLQERQVQRLGGGVDIPVDTRVIVATHRSLEDMMREGEFREDLYYRISEISLTLPPLRDRRGDPSLLACHFLRRFEAQRDLSLSKDAVRALDAWSWPGNVRELENRVKRASIMTEGTVVDAADLELEAGQPAPRPLKQVRADAERAAIRQTLSDVGFNMSQAARLLDVSRPTLYSLAQKHGIDVRRG